MKFIPYILLASLLLVLHSCKENDQPYVGYIKVDRVVLEAEKGKSVTVTAETDISESIYVTVPEADENWCSVSVNGKEITVTALDANLDKESSRSTVINVKSGYRETSFVVMQKYEGQEYLEYDWSNWTASGSDVQSSDGGGYPSLFSSDRTTFWHSQYSPVLPEPLPHQITVDMKQELTVAKVAIGRRHYAANGNNYPTVKTMEIYASLDNDEYTLVGQFTFALPWTAPDGTVVNGNSPLVPGDEEVYFKEGGVKARYMRMVITETNNTTGNCQVSYFRAFEKL